MAGLPGMPGAPRPQGRRSNLRAFTDSGVSRENAKYVARSLSISLYVQFWGKLNYNTLLFLTFIRSSFFVISGRKTNQALRELLYPSAVGSGSRFASGSPGEIRPWLNVGRWREGAGGRGRPPRGAGQSRLLPLLRSPLAPRTWLCPQRGLRPRPRPCLQPPLSSGEWILPRVG